MRKLTITAAFLTIFAINGSVQAASFNCGYAKLPAEVAICQSGELHSLDEKMAAKYYRLKRRMPRGAWSNVQDEQRRWIRRRNACGYDKYCLEDSYVYRIRSLNHWLSEY